MGNRNLVLDGAEGVAVATGRVRGSGEHTKTKVEAGGRRQKSKMGLGSHRRAVCACEARGALVQRCADAVGVTYPAHMPSASPWPGALALNASYDPTDSKE